MISRFSFLAAVVGAALLVGVAAPLPSNGQADTGTVSAALLTELAAQQTLLAENQAKIDAKVALIAEDVRQARLFVARGGGVQKTK